MIMLPKTLKRAKKIKKGSFAADVGGNVIVLFSLALVPLLAMVGATIDYSNGLNVKAKLQGAVDSGLLKVATDPTMVVGGSPGCANTTSCEAHIRQGVRDATQSYFARYMGQSPSVNVNIDADGTMLATATVSIPTHVMKFFGRPHSTVGATSEVKRGSAGGSEIALVLDTTGSMASPKIDGLKAAASQLVTTLLPSGSTNKVAMVPFDMYVNVGLANRNAPWISGANDYSVPGSDSCTTSWSISTPGTPVWTSATCSNDGIPYDCSYWHTPMTYSGTSTTTCAPTTSTYTWQGCVGSRNFPLDLSDVASNASPVPAVMNTSCAQPLTRLTSDAATLQAGITALAPYSETYIAPGLLWGWRALSPNQPFADGAVYGAKNKYLVLMTDGANTHSASYPAHANFDVADANSVTAQTCTAIKATGIKIYVIAFAVTDAAIISVLQSCASAPINYYAATTVTEMQTAFQTIGSLITKVRLSK